MQLGKNYSGIIGVNLTEQEVKFLANGQLDIDGAIIPFNQQCYNLQGKLIVSFVGFFTNKSICTYFFLNRVGQKWRCFLLATGVCLLQLPIKFQLQ